MAIAKATSITNKNPTSYVVHVYDLVSSTYSIKQVFFSTNNALPMVIRKL